MSPRNAKQLVAMSALVSFGVLFLASLSEREGGQLPSSRQWIGLAIAFLMMSILADLGVPMGGGLAVVTMIAMLLRKGGDALAFGLGKLGKSSSSPTSSTAQPGAPITVAQMQAAGARAQANLRPPAAPQRPPQQGGGGRMGGRNHGPRRYPTITT